MSSSLKILPTAIHIRTWDLLLLDPRIRVTLSVLAKRDFLKLLLTETVKRKMFFLVNENAIGGNYYFK